MVAFSHLSMIAFVILGLSMVRLMINYSSLLAKNHNDDPTDDVVFYWPHTAFCFITFFTIILFWWTSYPLRDLEYFPMKVGIYSRFYYIFLYHFCFLWLVK